MCLSNRNLNQCNHLNQMRLKNEFKDKKLNLINNLLQAAKIIQASSFDYHFVLGHKIHFLCVAKGRPLPIITWFKNGNEIFNHPFLQITQWSQRDVIKSKMEIDPSRQMDSATYQCQANNKYAIDAKTFKAEFQLCHLDVYYFVIFMLL